uniref:Uncharacterized protein n=1 Tax=Globisporangium ultimum (strain ATCC 200006 / CBS 805.95 / DAOM BR144) TaxID=431595 RepID=K3WIH6_GLOUD
MAEADSAAVSDRRFRSHDFSVPIETIAVFQQIYEGFLKAEGLVAHCICSMRRKADIEVDWARSSMLKLATCDEKRLCLVFDTMDNLFGNDALAIKFLKALNKWKAAS